ncbi:unnamed protein product [Enterobius vermicularis]|uniref:Elongation of fatty acids protein n=1 Tax=Enterobius vermicularis TaxID=51028 RepID=A0A0N4VKP8_ENTVE|nr:unnamed protein product [Enterobius vermicularis]
MDKAKKELTAIDNKPSISEVEYIGLHEERKDESAFDKFLDVDTSFDLVYKEKVISVWDVFMVTLRYVIVILALYGAIRHRYGYYVPFMFYSIVVIIHYVMVLVSHYCFH